MLKLLQASSFGLLLGLCPTLAVSTSIMNALGMGAASTFVLVFSNFFISLLRRFIPADIRIPIFIVIAVTFVSLVDMIMAGFMPDLYRALGIFIPLIVVNCIVLGRAESYAYKNNVIDSIIDGLYSGVAFTFGLLVLATIRELIGNNSLLGVSLFANIPPMLIMILPPGGLIVFGIILALIRMWQTRIDNARAS